MQTPAALPLPVLRICFAVILTLNAVACVKRRRDEDEDDVDACKRLRNDEERGTLRLTAVRRLLAMDASVFRKMFRMSKEAFLLLHSKCEQRINHTWTPRSARMAKVSSGSHVESLVLLACTIRWLAGGSPWDIAYAFHIAYSTLHSRKYDVINAINTALRDNINFPTSEAGLQKLADGFAGIAGGLGGTIPDVVAAVDSVVIQRKAPVASKERNVAGQYCRKGTATITPLPPPRLLCPTCRLLRHDSARLRRLCRQVSLHLREVPSVLARFYVVRVLQPWQKHLARQTRVTLEHCGRRCFYLRRQRHHAICQAYPQSAAAELQLLLLPPQTDC